MPNDETMPADWSEPLLPPGLTWLYVVAPIATALLMTEGLLDKPLGELLRALGSNYVPFVVFGAAFHVLYRYAMPPVLVRLRKSGVRILAHVTAVTLVSVLVAGWVRPVVEAVCGRELHAFSFAAMSWVISSCCIFPALYFQRLRVRARSAERVALAERQVALQAQLEALRARTDPHFLFNSLNTVASLIPEDPEQAERIVERLADLFRYALESSRNASVPLSCELAMIADYLAIQSARFGERLRSRVTVEDALRHVHIPPLLLQPLVENAIVHGMGRRDGGEIVLNVRRETDWLVIEVADDGPGPGASNHSGTGSAIAGIAERIRLHYAGRGQLALEKRAQGGCLARMTLPIIEAA